LKSTETRKSPHPLLPRRPNFSNFGSLKSTETHAKAGGGVADLRISAISAR